MTTQSISFPQSTTDANLTVTVTDCNDHPPVFIFTNTTSYGIIVSETPGLTSAKFDVLTTVDTTDADGTVANQAVTYSIVSSTFPWFEINPTSVSQSIMMQEAQTSICPSAACCGDVKPAVHT